MVRSLWWPGSADPSHIAARRVLLCSGPRPAVRAAHPGVRPGERGAAPICRRPGPGPDCRDRRRPGCLSRRLPGRLQRWTGCGRSHQDRCRPEDVGRRSAGPDHGQRPGPGNGRVPAVAVHRRQRRALVVLGGIPGQPSRLDRPGSVGRVVGQLHRSVADGPVLVDAAGPASGRRHLLLEPGPPAQLRAQRGGRGPPPGLGAAVAGAVPDGAVGAAREPPGGRVLRRVLFAGCRGRGGAPRCWFWADRRAACPGRWSRRCWPRTAIRRWPWRTSTRPASRLSCRTSRWSTSPRALRWLRAQPQVDSRHVLTLGVSRGSEAALLLGAYYPRSGRRGHRLGPQRRRDLLLSGLQRPGLDAARPAAALHLRSSITRIPPTTPPRSSRSGGFAARSSSTAAAPTRSGSPARTPGPSWPGWPPTATPTSTCCTPIRPPGTGPARWCPMSRSRTPRHRARTCRDARRTRTRTRHALLWPRLLEFLASVTKGANGSSARAHPA